MYDILENIIIVPTTVLFYSLNDIIYLQFVNFKPLPSVYKSYATSHGPTLYLLLITETKIRGKCLKNG